MFPFGGRAVVPFLNHRLAGDERRRRSGHQHRVTQFFCLKRSSSVAGVSDCSDRPAEVDPLTGFGVDLTLE